MRVLFAKNHNVPAGGRSRRMYKRGREYEVSDDIGKAAIEAERAKTVGEEGRRTSVRSATANAR